MNEGAVEKGALWHHKVGDRVTVIKALHIQPVFLCGGFPQVGRCGLKFYVAFERVRENLVQIVLPALDDGAIRQRDVDGRQLLIGSRNASECGSKTEKLW